jgi:hypothetical protein
LCLKKPTKETANPQYKYKNQPTKAEKTAKELSTSPMPKTERKIKTQFINEFYQRTALGTCNCSICKVVSEYIKEKHPNTNLTNRVQ